MEVLARAFRLARSAFLCDDPGRGDPRTRRRSPWSLSDGAFVEHGQGTDAASDRLGGASDRHWRGGVAAEVLGTNDRRAVVDRRKRADVAVAAASWLPARGCSDMFCASSTSTPNLNADSAAALASAAAPGAQHVVEASGTNGWNRWMGRTSGRAE